MPETRFNKGDLVSWRAGTLYMQGAIKEDLPPLGTKGPHRYLVVFRPDPESESLSQIELPADRLQSVEEAEFDEAVADFIGAFEVVFHHDWSYTKLNVGYMPGEDGTTFIEPGIEDEVDDWWARGALLNAYRCLVAAMEKRGLKPQFSDDLKKVMSDFKHRNR
jgi:hypothetical protein